MLLQNNILNNIKTNKNIVPFDEPDLDQLFLKMCPSHWQDQYSLTQWNILQDLRSLLAVLKLLRIARKGSPRRFPVNPAVSPETVGTLMRKSARVLIPKKTLAARKLYKAL
jgi:hypothetical protein